MLKPSFVLRQCSRALAARSPGVGTVLTAAHPVVLATAAPAACYTNPTLRRIHTASAMSDEASKAEEAKPEEVTLFDKIVKGDIPCDKIYEDDLCLAFNDIAPVAPVHFLVIPKDRDGLSQLCKAEDKHKALLGHLMVAAAKCAKDQGLADDGYRLVINDGKNGCQSVYHLHIHVIGGKKLSWPPGV